MSAFGLALMALGTTSCGEIKRGEYVKGAGTIYCDDGFKNVLEEEIEVFEYKYPGSSIIPKYVSEAEAIDALMGDSTQTIIVTHELSEDQKDLLKKEFKRVVKSKPIAVDAVALIVNKDNPVKEITMEEIGKILNGEVTRWSQLVSPDTTAINIVFDNQGSSTVAYMRDKFLGGKKITDNPNLRLYAEQNNSQVFDVVRKDKSAIGIISVSWLGDTLQNARHAPVEERIQNYSNTEQVVAEELTDEVTVLGVINPTPENDMSLQAYKPYQAYIATGEYPLFRTVYMITTASSSTLMKSFYDFVTGDIGQMIFAKTGILPYRMNRRVVELK